MKNWTDRVHYFYFMAFLRKVFGASKSEIWQQVADKVGAEYIDKGFWHHDTIRFEHDQWEILLDTYNQPTGNNSAVTYTRMRAPFVNKDGLRFSITNSNIFSWVGKAFGAQDIEIGDRYFDEHFIIKGNNEYQIRRLLNDRKLTALIQRQPNIHFKVDSNRGLFGKKFPSDVDQLYFQRMGIMKNADELKELFDLFSLTLERLVQIDSAYESDPGITLK